MRKRSARPLLATASLLTSILLVACGDSYPVVHEVPALGCEIHFVAREAHLFLAEYYRECYLSCEGAGLDIQFGLDSGGYSRVEFADLGEHEWLVSDAFEDIVVNPSRREVMSRTTRSPTSQREFHCNEEPRFVSNYRSYIGAIDRCNGEWIFIQPH